MQEINLPTEIIEIPIQDINFLDNEVMHHSDEQIDKIALSLQAFKFDNPIILGLYNNIYYVIAGGAVLKAACKIDLLTVPCIIIEDLTMEQLRAYAIADNNIAKNSGWDENLLSIELGHLDSLGFDLDYIGFDLTDADFAVIEEINYASKEPPIPTPAPKNMPETEQSAPQKSSTPTPLTAPVHNPVPFERPAIKTEPEPTKTEPEPTKTEPEPIKTEPEPIKTEPEPIKTEPEPIKTEPEPIKTEPEPIKTEPVIEKSLTEETKQNESNNSKTQHNETNQVQRDNCSDRQGLRQEEEKEEKEEKYQEKEIISCPRCSHSWSQ